MKKLYLLLFIAIIVFSFSRCTDERGARRILINSGYSNIEITGRRFFMGSRDDLFCTGFEADSPNGTRVTGAVTRGWFAGNTIRLD